MYWVYMFVFHGGSLSVWRRSAVMACLAFCGPGAWSAWPTGADSPRSLLEIRREGVVMQQWDNSCAAAALATVLRYGLNEPTDEAQVALGMMRLTTPELVQSRGGFSMLDMKLYAEARGFRATGLGRLSVKALTALHYPIVPLQSRAQAAHFVVVLSVSDEGVLVADPAFGRHRMSIDDFLARWRQGLALSINER